MAENVMNNVTNAKFIPTIIAQKALGRFAAYMNLAKTVARDFELTPTTVGETVRVAKRGTVSANDKTAGNNFTRQNPTATDVAVTLDQHKDVTISLDDVTKVLQNQDTLAGYAEDGAIALAEAVESKLAALHPSITNTITFDATSTATKKASLLNLRKRFVSNKVPKLETKHLYVEPGLYNELLEEADFTQLQTIGTPAGTTDASLFRLYGFEISESQLVETSGSPVRYHNLAYTRNAFVIASRPLPSVPEGYGAVSRVVNNEDIGIGLRVLSSYDPRIGAMDITLDLLFGVAILDERRVVELESS